MQCFILAGGFATRLWPITERRAKPLLPLAGKPLLSYTAEAVPQDIAITVSTNAVFKDDMNAWAKTMKNRNIKILIEDAGHENEKLGALGAVAKWIRESKIDDDILLLAGDNYVGCSMDRFLKLFRGHPLIAGHDIKEKEQASKFGTVVLGNNPPSPAGRGAGGEGLMQVISFEEKPANPKSTIVSTGWSILPKSTLPLLLEYAAKHPDNIGGIFEELLRKNITVDCFVFPEIWKDIGSFESYMDLHRKIVGEKTLVHPSSKTDGSIMKGANDIGPDTAIEKSTLTDCIVFGNSVIRDCVLERCIIDEHCKLESIDLTDKMLRAGTVLRHGNP